VKLGTSTFSMAAGHRKTVRVKLTRRGFELLVL
jgi:hypothetical protein